MGKLVLAPAIEEDLSMTSSIIRRAVVCAGVVTLAISLAGQTAIAQGQIHARIINLEGEQVIQDSRLEALESAPDSDTLVDLNCGPGDIAAYDGAFWVCADGSATGGIDGTQHIELAVRELLDRLTAVILPPRRHRHRYHRELVPKRLCVVPSPLAPDSRLSPPPLMRGTDRARANNRTIRVDQCRDIVTRPLHDHFQH